MASSRAAAITTRPTPLESVTPRHIAHGSQLVISSCAGRAGGPRVNERTRCWASMIATTSAWRTQFCSRVTLLTPAATRRPEAVSKTAAPNGPPVRRSTFSRARSTTRVIFSSSVRYAGMDLVAASTQDGTSITTLAAAEGASPALGMPVVTRRARRCAKRLSEIQVVAPGSDGAHGLEPIVRHVAVQLDAVAVGIGEIHAPGHVVLDGGLHRNADRLQLLVRRLQLLEAPELPRHVVQTGLHRPRRLARRELKEGQVVVLLAEAEEDGSPLEVFVGDLQPERSRVEIPRRASITDLQHDVTEFARLNHGSPPAVLDVCPNSTALRAFPRRPRSSAVGDEPIVDIPREVARIAPLKLLPAPVAARDDASALRSPARAGHPLGWITIDHRVVDGQLGARGNVMHRHERDLTADPDVRIAGVVEAEEVGFDVLGAAGCDVETILDLNLGGRYLVPDAGERGGIHDDPALDRDDLTRADRVTREEPPALDRARALLGLGTAPATDRRALADGYTRSNVTADSSASVSSSLNTTWLSGIPSRSRSARRRNSISPAMKTSSTPRASSDFFTISTRRSMRRQNSSSGMNCAGSRAR